MITQNVKTSLSEYEYVEIATDPQNAVYTILCDKYGMEPDPAFEIAVKIADEETKKAAKEAGFIWKEENIIEFDHFSIILEGFFADALDFDDPRVQALFEKYGLDFNKCTAAGTVSYETKCDQRKAGRGMVFVAGNEYGSWFAGFTISKLAMEIYL